MRSVPIGPFGETLTWPSPSSRAGPAKKSGWRPIQAARCSSMTSCVLATARRLLAVLAQAVAVAREHAAQPAADEPARADDEDVARERRHPVDGDEHRDGPAEGRERPQRGQTGLRRAAR